MNTKRIWRGISISMRIVYIAATLGTICHFAIIRFSFLPKNMLSLEELNNSSLEELNNSFWGLMVAWAAITIAIRAEYFTGLQQNSSLNELLQNKDFGSFWDVIGTFLGLFETCIVILNVSAIRVICAFICFFYCLFALFSSFSVKAKRLMVHETIVLAIPFGITLWFTHGLSDLYLLLFFPICQMILCVIDIGFACWKHINSDDKKDTKR